ncbi:hypothetical protein ACA910_008601 [Epithemia clementina (nom. ined.)]
MEMTSSPDESDSSSTARPTSAKASPYVSSLWNNDPANPSSDKIVSSTMQKGFENIIVQTGTGLVLGFLAGVVLAHRGGSSGARRVLGGLGAGIGLGSSWTKASMDLEDLLTPTQQQPKK